jgi:glycosyltransferase involved in cell wall biosynthesis
MASLKVSIITISYNNEIDISRTIQSVISQSYNNIEYLIIDGGSKDNTLDIVSKYKANIAKIVSESDNGIYDAINKGIKLSTGDIIGLIHAGDELYQSTTVQEIVSFFNANNIDAIYGNSKIYSADGLKVVRVNRSPEYNNKLLRLGWFPSHQSLYIKRELFDRFGLYNLKYNIAADYELLLRYLLVHKIKIKLLNEYIVKFKLGGTSTKSVANIIAQNKECIQAWSDNGLSIPFYTIPLKLLRKINQLFLAKIN